MNQEINKTESPTEKAEELDFNAIPSLDELMEELERSVSLEEQTPDEKYFAATSSGNYAGGAAEISDDIAPLISHKTTPENSREISLLRAELEQSKREQQDLLANYVRAQADFENFRKRVERERTEHYRHALSVVVTRLLPILDNFERAFANNTIQTSEKSAEINNFLNGIELIYRQMGRVLEEMGIEPIAAIGEPFDPAVHEAVATQENNELPPNTVIEEVVRGYQMGDKLIRPAMVKVTVNAGN